MSGITNATVKSDRKIVYILKGFPRLSESFIAGEVRLLTQMGLNLELYSIKPGDALASRDGLPGVSYCPVVESMSGISLFAWLRINFEPFKSSQTYLWHKHPLRLIKTLIFAIKSGFAYKAHPQTHFKKTFIKEFLLAGHIASRILRQGEVHHIHGHFCHDATTVTWMTSMLTGIPFSFTAHAKDIYQRKLNPGDLLERKLDATEFAVTCTQANVVYLRKRCTRPKKIYGIYHGLNINAFSPAADRVPKNNHLLSVGRHVEKKGFIYLIGACRVLRDRGIDFHLDIVGENGDQTSVLKQAILVSGLTEHVNLLPAMSQNKLVNYYQQAMLFVLPCVVVEDGDRDGIPNVMAEAMACGLPVIVTGISGIPELIDHGKNGLIVPTCDVVHLADTIHKALLDEDLRTNISHQARQRVESVFNAEHTHIELKQLFDRALGHDQSISI